MVTNAIIVDRIQEIYEELEKSIYTENDFPAPPGKHISRDAVISKKLLDELRENIETLKEETSSPVLDEISDLLSEGVPIDKYASYDETREASNILSELPYDENLDPGEVAGQRAAEKRDELLDEAVPDIQTVFEELLPQVINE